jgi:hypothetical protein
MGTAGTGQAKLRQARTRRVGRARVDRFFFKTVLYPFHTRTRLGYTGTTDTGTRARIFISFCVVFAILFVVFIKSE